MPELPKALRLLVGLSPLSLTPHASAQADFHPSLPSILVISLGILVPFWWSRNQYYVLRLAKPKSICNKLLHFSRYFLRASCLHKFIPFFNQISIFIGPLVPVFYLFCAGLQAHRHHAHRPQLCHDKAHPPTACLHTRNHIFPWAERFFMVVVGE